MNGWGSYPKANISIFNSYYKNTYALSANLLIFHSIIFSTKIKKKTTNTGVFPRSFEKTNAIKINEVTQLFSGGHICI